MKSPEEQDNIQPGAMWLLPHNTYYAALYKLVPADAPSRGRGTASSSNDFDQAVHEAEHRRSNNRIREALAYIAFF